jgi:probable rRNA maturation factor
MKLNVEINNLTRDGIDERLIKKTVKEIFSVEDFDYLRKNNISLSVAFVSEKEIERINKTYRHKDFPTDVLSFAEFKNEEEIKKTKEKKLFLGEIILCYNDIRKYCRKNNKKVSQELAKVTAHGLLHLLGWKHGKEMFATQDKISNLN